MQSEVIIILLNLIVLVFAYGVLNPTFAGRDLLKVLTQGLIALSLSLMVAGLYIAKKQHSFYLLTIDVGWFGFTLFTYLMIKTPLFLWYAKYWNIELSIHSKS
jgi:hypothetical protein